MMRKARVLLTVVLMAAFMLLIGSVQAQDNPKVFRYATNYEPSILIDYFDPGPAFTPMRFFMLPQWAKLPDGTVIPELVDELPSEANGGVSQTADGKSVIKFKIADWAVWSDGEPIVADDFKLVFDVATDGLSNLRASYRFIYGAKVDSITQGATNKDVVITFAGPQPDWTAAWILPLPAHILRTPYEAVLKEHKGMDTMVDYLRAPTVGDGPYVFAEWQAGQFIRFTRNPKFWKTPYFDEVIYSFYPDNNVIGQLLASGDTDFSDSLPFLDASDLVKQNPDTLQIVPYFTGSRDELQMNQAPTAFPALKDVNVRKAIAMAIDRKTMVDSLFNGQSKVPRSYWDDTPWFNKDTPQIGYNVDGAKTLLKQEGWYDADGDGVIESHGVKDVPDGTPFAVKGGTYADSWANVNQDQLLAVQDALGKVGIKLTISLFQFASDGSDEYGRGVDDLYVEGFSTGVDSIDQFQLYSCATVPTDQNPSGLNGSRICNTEMDKLWEVLHSSMSADERQNAANQIQDIMANQVLNIYLANEEGDAVMNKKIQGYYWGGFAGNPLISLLDMTRAK